MDSSNPHLHGLILEGCYSLVHYFFQINVSYFLFWNFKDSFSFLSDCLYQTLCGECITLVVNPLESFQIVACHMALILAETLEHKIYQLRPNSSTAELE